MPLVHITQSSLTAAMTPDRAFRPPPIIIAAAKVIQPTKAVRTVGVYTASAYFSAAIVLLISSVLCVASVASPRILTPAELRARLARDGTDRHRLRRPPDRVRLRQAETRVMPHAQPPSSGLLLHT